MNDKSRDVRNIITEIANKINPIIDISVLTLNDQQEETTIAEEVKSEDTDINKLKIDKNCLKRSPSQDKEENDSSEQELKLENEDERKFEFNGVPKDTIRLMENELNEDEKD